MGGGASSRRVTCFAHTPLMKIPIAVAPSAATATIAAGDVWNPRYPTGWAAATKASPAIGAATRHHFGRMLRSEAAPNRVSVTPSIV